MTVEQRSSNNRGFKCPVRPRAVACPCCACYRNSYEYVSLDFVWGPRAGIIVVVVVVVAAVVVVVVAVVVVVVVVVVVRCRPTLRNHQLRAQSLDNFLCQPHRCEVEKRNVTVNGHFPPLLSKLWVSYNRFS